MQANLVQESGVEELLRNVAAADDVNVVGAGGLACPLQSCLDPLGDEDVRGSALLDDGLRRTVGDNEAGSVEGRLLAPGADAQIGHAPTQNDRAGLAEQGRFEALDLCGRLAGEHPLVQPLAATPQRLVRTNGRSRDEPIQRHAQLQ